MYSYSFGTGQSEMDLGRPTDQSVGGFPIGILTIDARYPMWPGNVANATTFQFPVLYQVLRGVSAERIMCGDPTLLDLVLAGGRELVRQGVRAVVGACGSFAYFQKQTAAALPVPTFLSSMLQVPLISQSLKPEQKIGVIAASCAAITQAVFDQCEITDPSRLVITEACVLPEFEKLLGCRGRFSNEQVEREVVGLAADLVQRNPEIGAILLQCSDLPPYAAAIQSRVQLPVFDMTTLIEWVYHAAVRWPYRGFV